MTNYSDLCDISYVEENGRSSDTRDRSRSLFLEGANEQILYIRLTLSYESTIFSNFRLKKLKIAYIMP